MGAPTGHVAATLTATCIL